jgi:hypothetical protein
MPKMPGVPKMPTIAPQFNPNIEFEKAKQNIKAGAGQPAKVLSDAWVGARDNIAGMFSKKTKGEEEQEAARAAVAAKEVADQKLRDIPQMADFLSSGTLGDSGKFKASTISQSPWQAMAMKKQGVDQSMAGDALAKSSATQAAQGRALLSGRKGGGGVSESAGLAGVRDAAQGQQALASQGGAQRLDIAQQAAGKGLGTAQFNMGQTQQAAQANVAQGIKDLGQQNAYNRMKYGEQMKYKAGQETGAAMDKAGGKK